MNKKVALILADGFEIIEVMAPLDALRRGNVDVTTISIMDGDQVISGSNVMVCADKQLNDVDLLSYDMLIIPGGSLGVTNLSNCKPFMDALTSFMNEDKLVAAICAAPTLLADLHLLKGHTATCYPGAQTNFPEGVYQAPLGVYVDKNLITASGPGQALSFGLTILETLQGKEIAEEVARGLLTTY